MKKTTIFEDSGLKASEITGDIVKWLVYDGLEDKVVISHADDFVQLVLTTFVVGSIAAISGTMIKDFGRGVEKEIEKSKNKKIRESNQKKKLEKKKISITPKNMTLMLRVICMSIYLTRLPQLEQMVNSVHLVTSSR